jgi:ABC-type multidrug transport system fused ATPase/permease subunit
MRGRSRPQPVWLEHPLAETLPLIALQQVSLMPSLGSEPVLHQVSFEVQSGDRLVIVGPSGAGKTMLLQLLNRLRDPTGCASCTGV